MKDRWETGRIEAFSDGVFAIAITLLVLDLAVPASKFNDLWRGIADQWPSYLGYAASFLTIGAIWMAHHGIFRRVRYANAAVMRLNLMLLMAAAFLPFPTGLMASAINSDDAERAAVIFYGASLCVIFALIGALWGAILRDRELLDPGVDVEDIKQMTRSITPHAIGFLVAMALALVLPRVAAFGYLVLACVAVFRTRGDSGLTRPELRR